MNAREIVDALMDWEVLEADVGANPAFLLNQDMAELERARDWVERMKIHLEDVINYHHDMEEYNDVAN